MSNHPFELIPITIRVDGKVIESNHDEFLSMVRTSIAGINRQPTTDEEFGQAEQDVKALKFAEQAVKDAKAKALEDAQALQTLFSTLDAGGEEFRQARLALEKAITTRKAEVRAGLIEDAMSRIDYPASARGRAFGVELERAIKGKKSLDSMREALAVEVDAINALLASNRALLDAHKAEHGRVMDRDRLEIMAGDTLAPELRRRVELAEADRRTREAQAEAARLKAEAAKATPAPVAETPQPAPTPAPAVARDQSEAEEWADFLRVFVDAFAPVKAKREALKHAVNIAKGRELAAAMNEAFQRAKSAD